MIEQILKALSSNQLATGGLMVLFGGSVIGIFWKSLGYITRLFNYLFFVEINFTNDDTSFNSIQHWLFNQEYTKKRCSNLMVRNIYQSRHANRYGLVEDEGGNRQIFVPGYGNHYLFIKGRPATIRYTKADSKDLKNREFINIKVFCIFNKFAFSKKVVDEADKHFKTETYKETNIYTCIDRHSGYWHLLTKKNLKQNPILSYENEYQELISDIEHFLGNEQWYSVRGINYKRGFLFKGSPGSGKSSTILALAQHFKKHLYILNLADMTMDDSKFMELVSSIPSDAMVSFEDIDAASHDRTKETKAKDEQFVSLSTILNTLDGPFTPDRFIYIISTNHPDKLDPALIRPGRIDIVKDFKESNEWQRRAIFRRFLPDANKDAEDAFVNEHKGKSMALLENELIKVSI